MARHSRSGDRPVVSLTEVDFRKLIREELKTALSAYLGETAENVRFKELDTAHAAHLREPSPGEHRKLCGQEARLVQFWSDVAFLADGRAQGKPLVHEPLDVYQSPRNGYPSNPKHLTDLSGESDTRWSSASTKTCSSDAARLRKDSNAEKCIDATPMADGVDYEAVLHSETVEENAVPPSDEQAALAEKQLMRADANIPDLQHGRSVSRSLQDDEAKRRSTDEAKRRSSDAERDHDRERSELMAHKQQDIRERDGGLIYCAVSYARERNFACAAKLHSINEAWAELFAWAKGTARMNSKVGRFVSGSLFRLSVTAIILANSIFIFFDTNRLIRESLTGDKGDELFFNLAEKFFIVFYTVEFALKFYVYRLAFFCNEEWSWNTFDLFLLVFGYITLVLENSATDTMFLRLVRMLKIVKVLRSFRLMQQLESLRVLLHCLLGTLWELFWSIIMLLIVFFMFATVLCQLVATYIENYEGNFQESEDNQALLAHFGSEEQSILTLFKACTGGDDWSSYYDLIARTGWAAAAAFLFFMCFTQVAFLNIITGLFIERALVHAKPDLAQRVGAHRCDNTQLIAVLERLAHNINYSGDDLITQEEFVKTLHDNAELRCTLEMLGLDLMDHKAFFQLLLIVEGLPLKVELFDVCWHDSWEGDFRVLCEQHGITTDWMVQGHNGSEFELQFDAHYPRLDPLPNKEDFPLTVSKVGGIPEEHFIAGCLKLRGSASSREMHALNLKMNSLMEALVDKGGLISETCGNPPTKCDWDI